MRGVCPYLAGFLGCSVRLACTGDFGPIFNEGARFRLFYPYLSINREAYVTDVPADYRNYTRMRACIGFLQIQRYIWCNAAFAPDWRGFCQFSAGTNGGASLSPQLPLSAEIPRHLGVFGWIQGFGVCPICWMGIAGTFHVGQLAAGPDRVLSCCLEPLACLDTGVKPQSW